MTIAIDQVTPYFDLFFDFAFKFTIDPENLKIVNSLIDSCCMKFGSHMSLYAILLQMGIVELILTHLLVRYGS